MSWESEMFSFLDTWQRNVVVMKTTRIFAYIVVKCPRLILPALGNKTFFSENLSYTHYPRATIHYEIGRFRWIIMCFWFENECCNTRASASSVPRFPRVGKALIRDFTWINNKCEVCTKNSKVKRKAQEWFFKLLFGKLKDSTGAS